jgi:hypothetical protein
MPWNPVDDFESRHLPVQEQLFAFADSYLSASCALCQQLVSDPETCTYPSGAVVLMLAAHAVELFLKGAILTRQPTADVWSRLHDLEALASDFRSCFPEPEFSWYIPFQAVIPEGLSDAELQAIKAQSTPPSILFRYPVQKGGAQWRTLSAFEPHSFFPVLHGLRHDFARILAQLAGKSP